MCLSESVFAFRSKFPKSEKAKKVPENLSNDEFSGKMEKNAYFDRITGWGSAPAWVGFSSGLGGGSSYVNQAPRKENFQNTSNWT